MSDLLPCPFCGSGHVSGDGEGDDNWFECMACHARGPRTTFIDATDTDADRDAWNRRAPADPALLALDAVDLSRYRSVLPMAPHDQARGDAERALARFGAYVVRDWFRRTSGFQAADGHQLDAGALETGVVTHGATAGFRCSSGIADAIAALLAPDGAGEVADG